MLAGHFSQGDKIYSYTGVAGNNVPWKKCPGNNIFYCNDFNLRSLVSIPMHLNPSTNNEVGHLFQWDNHYCYTCPKWLHNIPVLVVFVLFEHGFTAKYTNRYIE
jgi:hypothetical protein